MLPPSERVTIHTDADSRRVEPDVSHVLGIVAASLARSADEEYSSMNSLEQKMEHKTFTCPDEVREFPNGKAEILDVGGVQIGRMVFQPRKKS